MTAYFGRMPAIWPLTWISNSRHPSLYSSYFCKLWCCQEEEYNRLLL